MSVPEFMNTCISESKKNSVFSQAYHLAEKEKKENNPYEHLSIIF